MRPLAGEFSVNDAADELQGLDPDAADGPHDAEHGPALVSAVHPRAG